MTVSARIKAIREAKKISQATLADALNVSQVAISKMEKSENISINRINEVAIALGVSPSYLAFGEGVKNSDKDQANEKAEASRIAA